MPWLQKMKTASDSVICFHCYGWNKQSHQTNCMICPTKVVTLVMQICSRLDDGVILLICIGQEGERFLMKYFLIRDSISLLE